jgi:hypothetical protein
VSQPVISWLLFLSPGYSTCQHAFQDSQLSLCRNVWRENAVEAEPGDDETPHRCQRCVQALVP